MRIIIGLKDHGFTSVLFHVLSWSISVVLKVGGANTLQGGRDVTDGEKKTTADLSLVSESSLSGEMQGAGLTQTNQILFCS